MVGTGSPVAWQEKEAVSPSFCAWFITLGLIDGATKWLRNVIITYAVAVALYDYNYDCNSGVRLRSLSFNYIYTIIYNQN